MERKRKPTLEERIAADPELQEIFSTYDDDWMLERMKQRHRAEKQRLEHEARRRARLRRLTFGLLGR